LAEILFRSGSGSGSFQKSDLDPVKNRTLPASLVFEITFSDLKVLLKTERVKNPEGAGILRDLPPKLLSSVYKLFQQEPQQKFWFCFVGRLNMVLCVSTCILAYSRRCLELIFNLVNN
jgi:hypothetical protein